MITPGSIVRLDFPGHHAHGARVTVIRIDSAFNLAPEGDEPQLAEVIFVRHPSWPEAVGVGRDAIGGTVENAARLREERGEDDDPTQGEFLL